MRRSGEAVAHQVQAAWGDAKDRGAEQQKWQVERSAVEADDFLEGRQSSPSLSDDLFLVDAGVFVSGAGLEKPETATTVKLVGGQRQVQDGPYADTKEQLGGFFIINVPNLDAALGWAARCPVEPDDVIEVRPNLQVPG